MATKKNKTFHAGATVERGVYKAAITRARTAYDKGTLLKGKFIMNGNDVLNYLDDFTKSRVARFKKVKGGL